MAYADAVLTAMEDSDSVDVSTSNAVARIRAVGDAEQFFTVASEKTMDYEIDSDTVSVEIRVESCINEPTPDIEVCEFCENNLRGEADG